MKVDFDAQVVLVTGATRGIGKQIALDFAGLGARLILTGTQQSQSDALNQALKERGKNWGKYYCVDFAKRESMEAFLQELGHLERIDVCINNAGINRIDYLEEIKEDDWVHWDLVLIQRPEYGGGELWFDDVLIRKDGLFVLPELGQLNPDRLLAD